MKIKAFFAIMFFMTFVSMTFVSGAFVLEDCEAECFAMTDNNAVNDCLDECNALYEASLEEESVEEVVVPELIAETVVQVPEVIDSDVEEVIETGEEVFEDEEVVEETSHSDLEDAISIGCTTTTSGKDCSIEGYYKFVVEGDVTITEENGEVVVSASGEEATLTLRDGSRVTISSGEPFTLEKKFEEKGFVAKLKSIWRGFWGKLFGNKFSSGGKANAAVRG